MSNCSLAGIWMGNPSQMFYTMVMSMTQDGTAVTAGITAWLVPAWGSNDQVSYSLAGTVGDDGTFSLKSTGGNPLQFTGTCSDANHISGTLHGQMDPGGGTQTAQISCVRLNATYPSSVTGQWQGSTDEQSASLSLLQSGTSVSGVGSVSLPNGEQVMTFNVSVPGSVTYPAFSLSLNSTNARLGWNFTFSGSASDPNTMAGEIQGIGPLTLNRVPASPGLGATASSD